MKIFLLLIGLSLVIKVSHGQTFVNDERLKYLSPFLTEKSASNKTVGIFSIGILQLESKNTGIELNYNLSPNTKSLRPDSIILVSTDNKEIILDSPYRDTVWRLRNTSLQVAAVHFLEPPAHDFLRQKNIKAIVIIVNDEKSFIYLGRKNAARLKKIVN